jgi:hypothetical protein
MLLEEQPYRHTPERNMRKSVPYQRKPPQYEENPKNGTDQSNEGTGYDGSPHECILEETKDLHT